MRRPLLASATALLSLLAFAPAPLEAQLLKKLGDRAKEAAERKAEQKMTAKIDEATSKLVDKSFNAVFGDDNGGGGGGGGGKSSKGGGSSRLFSLLPNAPTEARYDFSSEVTYEIESMPKGKSSGEVGVMTMLFSKEQPFAGVRFVNKDKPKDGAFNMIFDAKNESMVMLFESDTGKFSMAYSWKEAKRYADAQTSAPPPKGGDAVATTTVRPDGRQVTYTKIGSKRIAGFNTEGYRAEDNDGIVDVWVANDPSLTYGRMMGVAGSMRQTRNAMPDSYPVGVMMATETLDKKSGDRGRMTVTSVNTRAKTTIDMAQYPKLGASN